MIQRWEYKVEKIVLADNPYGMLHGMLQGGFPTKAFEELLQKLGDEGWELMHVKDVKGAWCSNPEMYPGGDPGRMTWGNGESIFFFKKPVIQEAGSAV